MSRSCVVFWHKQEMVWWWSSCQCRPFSVSPRPSLLLPTPLLYLGSCVTQVLVQHVSMSRSWVVFRQVQEMVVMTGEGSVLPASPTVALGSESNSVAE